MIGEIQMQMQKDKKKYITYGIIFVAIIIVLGLFYIYKIQPRLTGYNVYRQISATSEEYLSMGELDKKTTVKQTFVGERESFVGFELMFRKAVDTPKDTEILVELFEEDDTLIEKWLINMNGIADWQTQRFLLQTPILDARDREFVLKISSPNLGIAGVAVTNVNKYEKGLLYLGENKYDYTMAFSLVEDINFIKRLFQICCVLIVTGFLAICFLILKKNKQIENYFLILGIVFGSIMILLLPPGISPDDHAHIATVYRNANILTGQKSIDEEGKVIVRYGDASIQNTYQLSLNTLSYYNDLLKKENSIEDASRVSFDRGPLSVPLLSHLPQSVGVSIGWILGLSGIVTLYLGKCMALIFYLVVVYFAIKYLPWGKMMLAMIALFPMSMQLATSFNYDSIVNPLSFFAISYTMYLIYEKEKVTWKDYLILGIVFLWMVPCKVIYVFLCGIIFFIPSKKSENPKVVLVWKVGILIIVFFSLLFLRLNTVQSLISSAERSTYTIPQILNDIPKSIGVIFETYFAQASYYLGGVIGQSLGWFQIDISWFVVAGYIVLFVLALCEDGRDSRMLPVKMKIASIVFCVIMLGGIVLSMWLDFTPNTHPYIAGVQGRYILPFLPLFMLCIKSNVLSTKKEISGNILVGTFIFQILTVLDIWNFVL